MTRKLVFQGRLTENDWVTMILWIQRANGSRVIYTFTSVLLFSIVAVIVWLAVERVLNPFFSIFVDPIS